eukprot:COSAG04_NODE_170_length_21634_cov_12.250337_3_plen_271_part_00
MMSINPLGSPAPQDEESAAAGGLRLADDGEERQPLPDYFQRARRWLHAKQPPAASGLEAGLSGEAGAPGMPRLSRFAQALQALLLLYPLYFGVLGSAAFPGIITLWGTEWVPIGCGFIVWLLAPGIPALRALCAVSASGAHLARLGADTAAVPASVARSVERWRRVIKGAFGFLSLTFGVFLSSGALRNLDTGDVATALSQLFLATFFVLWLAVVCTWWFSLKVGATLALVPVDDAVSSTAALLTRSGDADPAAMATGTVAEPQEALPPV